MGAKLALPPVEPNIFASKFKAPTLTLNILLSLLNWKV